MKKKLLLIIFSILIISGVATAAIIATRNNYRGYKISSGGFTIGIIYTGDFGSASRNVTFANGIKEHGLCRIVSSTNSKTIFIPTRTLNERSNFVVNKPLNTTLSMCGCERNQDCTIGECCNGYVPPADPTCIGTYTVTTVGTCEGEVAGSPYGTDGTDCSVYTTQTTCQAGWATHGCRWDSRDQTETYDCDFTTSSTCTSHVGCSRFNPGASDLGTCGACEPSGGGGTSTGTTCIPGVPGSCFIAGTKVKLQDGTTKNIEDIKTDDKIVGLKNNTVQKPLKIWYTGKLYSINGSDYFVTSSHPFMTTEGWKSFDPNITKIEIPDLFVKKMEIGDVLVKENGIEQIYQANYKEINQYVYNFELDGDHTYYADGYLVHNKLALGPGCSYNYSCASNACVGGNCVSTTTTPSVNACCSCSITAQCPVGYDCTSGVCTKDGVSCAINDECAGIGDIATCTQLNGSSSCCTSDHKCTLPVNGLWPACI